MHRNFCVHVHLRPSRTPQGLTARAAILVLRVYHTADHLQDFVDEAANPTLIRDDGSEHSHLHQRGAGAPPFRLVLPGEKYREGVLAGVCAPVQQYDPLSDATF